LQGQWKGSTAGGCINEVTFRHNTFYSLAITKRPTTTTTTTVCILLQQKKQAIDLIPGQILPYPCHIGFYVYTKGLLSVRFSFSFFFASRPPPIRNADDARCGHRPEAKRGPGHEVEELL
jgi:hypothetical protein